MIAAPGYAQGGGAAFMVIPKDEVDEDKSNANGIAAQFRASYSKPMWLNRFLESTGAYMDGTRITRREIIDFIANAMGGTHYDPSTHRSDKVARALLKPLHVRWRGNSDVHAPWIEMMSIGQSVAWSTDAERFNSEFSSRARPADMPLSGDD